MTDDQTDDQTDRDARIMAWARDVISRLRADLRHATTEYEDLKRHVDDLRRGIDAGTSDDDHRVALDMPGGSGLGLPDDVTVRFALDALTTVTCRLDGDSIVIGSSGTFDGDSIVIASSGTLTVSPLDAYRIRVAGRERLPLAELRRRVEAEDAGRGQSLFGLDDWGGCEC